MKLCIVLPSANAFNQAGARIRYYRLIEPLGRCGIDVTLRAIDDVKLTEAEVFDAYLISKIYDVRALILAYEARLRGSHVGIDLFDDYFSGQSDSRLFYQRRWFRRIVKLTTFTLSSTPAMLDVAKNYSKDVPALLLNDPFDAFDAERVGVRVASKAGQARSDRIVRLGWFGIASNPFFSIGISDLAAFESMLCPLRARGYSLELDVLTNSRSLNAALLERLRSVGIKHRVSEWSRVAEISLLNRVLATVIPVNAQPFSTAKSLNRAITALTNASQVISLGYPLYHRLDQFVYSDLANMIDDLAADRLRLRSATAHQLETLLASEAGPTSEAERLAAALYALPAAKQHRKVGPGVLLNGKLTTKAIHTFARGMGLLSVGSPFSPSTLNYDVSFSLDVPAGKLRATLNQRALKRLKSPSDGTEHDSPNKRTFTLSDRCRAALGGVQSAPMSEMVAYPVVMDACLTALDHMFPSNNQVVSEEERSFQLYERTSRASVAPTGGVPHSSGIA